MFKVCFTPAVLVRCAAVEHPPLPHIPIERRLSPTMPGMNLTREEAQTRAELITVDSYEVALDLTGSDTVFGSHTTVRFSAVRGIQHLHRRRHRERPLGEPQRRGA